MLSSCSACLLPPADYPLWDSIGDSIVKHGLLSQLQLEGIMYASMKHLQWLPSGQRASNCRATAAFCAAVGMCCRVTEMRAVQAMHVSYWVCQALSCDWVCNVMLRVIVPIQARGSSLVMALGWERAARLRALYWTTLHVAAAVQCGCPQVSIDVSSVLTSEALDCHT